MAPEKGHHTGRDPAHQNPSEGQADPTSATILARTPDHQTPPYAGQLQHQAHQSAPNSGVTWTPVAGATRTSLSKTLPPPFSGAFPAPIFPQFPIKFFCNRLQSFDRGIVVIYQRNHKKSQQKMAVAAMLPVAAPSAGRSRPLCGALHRETG